MLFGLLLALLVAALAVVVHIARMRSLERELIGRVAGQIQGFSTSQEEARRTAEEVSSLERSKSRVLVNLMNDLRTPLMMIKSPLQTTMQIAGAPDLDDNDVERMMQQANRLQRGLDQIQRVLELDLGGTALNYQLSDFIDFSEQFVTSLRPLAERHGVTIHFSSDPDALPFAFDTEKIEQVLQSFVERAFTGMSAGDTLQFLLTTRRLSQDGVDRVALEISDNGKPIDEKYLKILRTQGNWGAYENAIVDMTALGLALAHRFVVLHGGEIELDRLESGTRVRVFLPIRIDSSSKAAQISGDTLPIPADLSALLSGDQFSKPEKLVVADQTDAEMKTTILVVDDHPGTRGYLAYALRKHHKVVEASNGAEALALVKEINPDLVISDIMMPVMDGNELCRAIKSDEKLNHIPIFLVTANAVSTMRKESLESGADDYLTKP
ncbi:MAG: response regulator, partial [Rhodothermales bacterium]